MSLARDGHNKTVVVVRTGNPGLIAGIFGCVLGLLGLFTIGIIFVPLAAICSLVGLLRGLSRDSRLGQRIGHPFAIEVCGGIVNSPIEGDDVGECLMGEMVPFQVAPGQFDVVEFWRVFRKPFDGKPVCAGGERGV
jgi:hypothetical protein